jgi:DNA-binding NarL/FixJ family response regulator
MTVNSVSGEVRQEKISRRNLDELGFLLYHCWDLPVLQTSELIHLPAVKKRAEEEKNGLAQAKALRKELIACAEQITQRPRYPIEDIVNAIEKENMKLGSQDLLKIRRTIGIPFSRKRLDLARYYTIRLIMQGVDQHTIAEFLDVDLRTVANYVAQAKDRIRLVLETRSLFE